MDLPAPKHVKGSVSRELTGTESGTIERFSFKDVSAGTFLTFYSSAIL